MDDQVKEKNVIMGNKNLGHKNQISLTYNQIENSSEEDVNSAFDILFKETSLYFAKTYE